MFPQHFQASIPRTIMPQEDMNGSRLPCVVLPLKQTKRVSFFASLRKGHLQFLTSLATVFWNTKKPWTNVNFTAPRFTWRYQSHSIRSFLKKMHQPGNPFFGKASYVNQGLHLQNPMILKILNQSHLVQLR